MTKKFPKDLKHTLGKELIKTGLNLITQIIIANQSIAKKNEIQNAIIQIECMFTYVRMSEDFKAITAGEFQVISEFLYNISTELNAWLKWDKKRNID